MDMKPDKLNIYLDTEPTVPSIRQLPMLLSTAGGSLSITAGYNYNIGCCKDIAKGRTPTANKSAIIHLVLGSILRKWEVLIFQYYILIIYLFQQVCICIYLSLALHLLPNTKVVTSVGWK